MAKTLCKLTHCLSIIILVMCRPYIVYLFVGNSSTVGLVVGVVVLFVVVAIIVVVVVVVLRRRRSRSARFYATLLYT